MQTRFPSRSRLLAQTHRIEIESTQTIAKFRKCNKVGDINQAVEVWFLGGAHKAKIL